MLYDYQTLHSFVLLAPIKNIYDFDTINLYYEILDSKVYTYIYTYSYTVLYHQRLVLKG